MSSILALITFLRQTKSISTESFSFESVFIPLKLEKEKSQVMPFRGIYLIRLYQVDSSTSTLWTGPFPADGMFGECLLLPLLI